MNDELIKEILIQLSSAFAGSVGFAIILKIRGKQIIFAGLGGMVTWGIYLISYGQLESYFMCNLIAAVFVAVYAEIMARVNRAPTTIFLTAAAVPLIPGGKLYYTMYGLVSQDYALFETSGREAVVIALAISLGFVVVAVISKYMGHRNKSEGETGVV